MANSFIPQAFQPDARSNVAPETPSSPEPKSSGRPDKIGLMLLKASQYVTVLLALLLPIAFVPGLGVSLGFNKAFLALGLGIAAVILLSLSALRFKKVQTVVPLPLILFWLIAIAGFISALLSGDIQDSLRGSSLEVQTAAFLGVMALTMTTALVLQQAKKLTLYTLIAFAAGAGLLFVYNLIRFIFGPVLGFGSFGTVTVSPIGGLNDLAVYAGITVVIGLITLLQLPLKKWMSAVISALIVLGLLILMVANFFYLWIVVGFFALLFLIYVLSRDTLFGDETTTVSTASPFVIFSALIVCIVSVLFVVAGDYAGGQVSEITGVNYIEVRPSLTATADVLRSVYQEDILLGTGPNRFADAWRLFKDRSINETTFWNVEFAAGFGLIPTFFVTLGLLGGLLIVAFHGSFLYLAYRSLLRNDSQDAFWYYVGTVSFTAATILWGISYVYVPGAAVLLITAIFTGLSIVSYSALVTRSAKTIQLANNRKRGLFLMGIAVFVIVVSVTLLFAVARQYSAQATFAAGAQSAASIEEFEGSVQTAYNLYSDERFLIALNQLKLSQLQGLLAIEEPTEADQTQFANIAQQSISLANETLLRDNTSPAGYIALGDIYSILNRAGVEGAAENVRTSITEAERRDPFNPSYNLSRAFLAAQAQEYEEAREHINAAIALKNNFTAAYFLLAQIAVEEGNVEQAIAATQQVVRFEPNNPVRYYQLGMLLAANEQLPEAIQAYRQALTLDENYANARYMLGLALASQGDAEAALVELRRVQENNQENEQLRNLIAELASSGTLPDQDLGLEAPVAESSAVENSEEAVVAEEAPDTDLITSVNTEPVTNEEAPTEPDVDETNADTTQPAESDNAVEEEAAN